MIDLSKNTKVNKLRAYILNYYPYIEDIVKLQKADAIGTGMAKEEDIVNRLEEQYVIMKENKLPFCLKDLKINGKDLLNIGYQGKQIQIMLEEILYQCAIEKIKNSYDDLMIYAQKLGGIDINALENSIKTNLDNIHSSDENYLIKEFIKELNNKYNINAAEIKIASGIHTRQLLNPCGE